MPAATTVESELVPMRIADIDTDQVISSRHLTSRTTEEFAAALFSGRRSRDADFILNQPNVRDRKILLAGRNFGCGSSREAAVWALQAWGFASVIAPSFGAIFSNNAVVNGLILVRLSEADCDSLEAVALAEPHRPVIVDLGTQVVRVPDTGFTATFPFDPFYRDLLMGGITELDYLLQAAPEAAEYEKSHQAGWAAR